MNKAMLSMMKLIRDKNLGVVGPKSGQRGAMDGGPQSAARGSPGSSPWTNRNTAPFWEEAISGNCLSVEKKKTTLNDAVLAQGQERGIGVAETFRGGSAHNRSTITCFDDAFTSCN